jgi:hypothetical protein
MSYRGRPVLGAISGLLFGVAVALFLQQAGVRPIDNVSFFGLPLLGLALGLGLALWAPLGRDRVVAASGATASAEASTEAETED